MSYAPKLPLQLDDVKKDFVYIKDFLENAKQKLKMILFTNPGEKIYDPEFGVGIYKYIFEPSSGIIIENGLDNRKFTIENFENNLYIKISNQVLRYGQNIKIQSVSVSTDNNTMNINIIYSVADYLTDSIIISSGM